jgi:hypothetical protein
LSPHGNSVLEFYTTRAAEFGRQAEALRARARITSNARLVLFFIIVAVLVVVEGNLPVFVVALLIGIVTFIGAVSFHRRIRARLQDAEARQHLCELGVARIQRDWSALPTVLQRPTSESHPYATDLDLFGAPAVSQLFGPVRTVHGARTLRCASARRPCASWPMRWTSGNRWP